MRRAILALSFTDLAKALGFRPDLRIIAIQPVGPMQPFHIAIAVEGESLDVFHTTRGGLASLCETLLVSLQRHPLDEMG